MPADDRVFGTWAVGQRWGTDQLRSQLIAIDHEAPHLVRIAVSPTDLDPAQARRRVRAARRTRTALLAVVLVAAILIVGFPGIRHGVLTGFGGAWLWSVLWFAMNWGYRSRVATAVPEGSQAESFVRALLFPTANTHAIVARWLVFTDPEDAMLVTQEERWSSRGPQSRPEVVWTAPTDGRLETVDRSGPAWRSVVRLTFADGSTTRLNLPRRDRDALIRGWQSAP